MTRASAVPEIFKGMSA